MKTFNKKFYILVAVLLIVGTIFTAVGITLGASKNVYIDETGVHFDKNHLSPYRETIAVEDYKKIDLEASFTNIEIIQSDRNEVVISGTRENLKPQVNNRNKVLDITTSKKKGFFIGIFSMIDHEAKITVYVKDPLEELELEGAFSEIKIQNITAQRLELKTSFSETTLDGEYKLIDIENNFGDINGTIQKTGNVKVENDFGTIILSLDQKIENYTLQSENSFGNVKINGNNVKEVVKKMNGNSSIKIQNNFGDVDINF